MLACLVLCAPDGFAAAARDYLTRRAPGRADANAVVHNGMNFITVRDSGNIAVSEDGVQWTNARTPGIRTDLNAVAYDGLEAVAAGNDGQVAVTRDGGRTWEKRQLGWEGGMFPLEADLRAVARSQGNWIVGGQFGWVWLSNDGDNWGRAWPMFGSSMGGADDPTWNGMAAAPTGKVVAVGDANTIGHTLGDFGVIYWTTIKVGLPEQHDFQSVLHDGRRFVAVASSGYLATSEDGETWEGSLVGELEEATSITFGEDRYVVATSSNGAYTSGDLELWQVEDPAVAGQGVAFGGDSFVIVGARGVFHQSPPLFQARAGGRMDHPGAVFDDGQPLAPLISLPRHAVNTTSLDLVLEGLLFRMPTNGPPIAGHFVFNAADSETDPPGMFGRGWGFAYESSIALDGSMATLRRGSGAKVVFRDAVGPATPADPVLLTSPQGNFDRLRWFGNYWELEEKDTKWTYRYDQPDPAHPARLTSITDRNGNQIVISVDQASGVIAWIRDRQHAAGARLIHFTNIGGRCHAITLPDGRALEFTYQGPQAERLGSIRDMQGNLATYQYDGSGYLTMIGHPNGGAHNVFFSYVPRDGNGGKIIRHVTVGILQNTYEFVEGTYGTVRHRDGSGSTTLFQSRDGRTTQVADPLKRVRSVVYQGRLPTRIVEPSGAATQWEYDTRGNPVRSTDPLGHATVYTYDARDNLLSDRNALNETWTYQYDGNGNLLRIVSPLGAITDFTYDALGRPQTLKDARGKTTTLLYDNNGNLIRLTNPLGHATHFHYDTHGMRLTGYTCARGHLKSTLLDANERLASLRYDSVAPARIISHVFSPYWLESRTDELGREVRFDRNLRGMVTRRVDPLGHSVQVEYDGADRPVRRIDELGRATRIEYDANGRPLRTHAPDGGVIRRAYDEDGNLTTLSGPNRNQSTFFDYDAAGRVVLMRHADRSGVTHQRDPLGRIARTAVIGGGEVFYTYDAEGRLASVRQNENPAATFTYDASGNLLRAQAPDGSFMDHTYDDAGRLVSITDSVTGGTATFVYDAVGNITRITYPDGTTLNLAYDTLNRLPLPPLAASAAAVRLRESGNRVTGATWNGGRWVDFNHDNASRLTRVLFHTGAASDYDYDANDNILFSMHSLAGVPFSETSSQYNAAGNVIMLDQDHPVDPPLPAPAVSRYDSANKFTRHAGARPQYDAAGNLTDSGNGRLTAAYDTENRVVAITVDGVQMTFTYDALGHRSSKTVNGVTTRYVHTPDGNLLFEHTQGQYTNYLRANGRLFATGSLSGGFHNLLMDRRGSIAAVSNDAGELIETLAYSPYGLQATDSGEARTGPTFVGAYGVLHDGGGIHLMRQRHYDSITGRFLQRDPIGFAGGINLYAYAAGNPLNRIDPLGTQSSRLYRWTVGWLDPREYHPVTRTVLAGTGAGVGVAVAGAPAGVAIGTGAVVSFLWGLGESAWAAKNAIDEALEAGREFKARTEAIPADPTEESFHQSILNAEQGREATQDAMKSLGGAAERGLDVH